MKKRKGSNSKITSLRKVSLGFPNYFFFLAAFLADFFAAFLADFFAVFAIAFLIFS